MKKIYVHQDGIAFFLYEEQERETLIRIVDAPVHLPDDETRSEAEAEARRWFEEDWFDEDPHATERHEIVWLAAPSEIV